MLKMTYTALSASNNLREEHLNEFNCRLKRFELVLWTQWCRRGRRLQGWLCLDNVLD